ncbi:hypothetical protein [Capnocytophaga sp. oral taxon 326]|uniref:hypothetical protein n=1 Tax=Capnocytophaga sp. oral taxon 326 TaxID=712212 RepID=UPI0002A1F9C7|nr:hypothetical protein [Capnocytophaga sp. oral taxon 326]EKY17500.1 hypothetical protein HMPREF9073_01447 [Capnocytophaga sp. oral taxon 326 str. F0382]
MKKILFSLLAVATLIGCCKNDDNGSDSANHLVKKITAKNKNGNLEEVITFTFQGGRPISQHSSYYKDGVQTGTTQVTTIHYEGNLVKKVKTENAGRKSFEENYFYENGKLSRSTEKRERNDYTTTYEYSYTNNQVTTVLKSYPTTIYLKSGDTQSGTRYTERQFTYNGNTVIEVETGYEKDLNGVVVTNTVSSNGTQTITYTLSGGNVVKKVEETEYSTTTREYTYDTKHNPRYEMIGIFNPDPTKTLEAYNGKNNVIKEKYNYTEKSGSRKIVFIRTSDHTYNADGYPTIVKLYTEENGVREFNSTIEYEY